MVLSILCACYIKVHAHAHPKNKFDPHYCIFHKKYHQFDIYDPMTSFELKISCACTHYACYIHVHAHTYRDKFNLHNCISHKKNYQFDMDHPMISLEFNDFLCTHRVCSYAFYVHVTYKCMHMHTKIINLAHTIVFSIKNTTSLIYMTP